MNTAAGEKVARENRGVKILLEDLALPPLSSVKSHQLRTHNQIVLSLLDFAQ